MTENPRAFERVDSRAAFEGRIVTVCVETFRYPDGETAEREIVRTTDAAAIVAVDDDHVWLVRQPREPIDDPDSLELPAGRLDQAGETALQTAQRELEEEIGKRAEHWEELSVYHSSVGLTDETVHVFLAQGLADAGGEGDAGVDERIEIVRWPLERLDEAIAQVTDAKTLIGLLLYDRRRRGFG